MKYSGHRKLLYELSKLSKLNAGFNMYAEYTQPQLTFLSLVPCLCYSDNQKSLEKEVDSSY